MIKIACPTPDVALIEMPDGRVFTVRDDKGGALELALRLTDWQPLFDREDNAEETTNPGVDCGTSFQKVA